jgi:hypothetical protein
MCIEESESFSVSGRFPTNGRTKGDSLGTVGPHFMENISKC